MSRLIDELKQEHVAIEQLFARVRDPETTHRDAHRILIEARSGLILHLKKEDALLYPALHKAAAKDPALARTIELYTRDMEEITNNVISFYEKYSSPSATIDAEFAAALGVLIGIISRRMRNEENTLYAAYEKVI